VKPGDLVELLEPTMGSLLSSGVRGVIIKQTKSDDVTASNLMYKILVAGKIKTVSARLIRKVT
tara:strand:- start:460 stop:648 length:189 start_codon:yes stop_codon:yes gene_type:complete